MKKLVNLVAIAVLLATFVFSLGARPAYAASNGLWFQNNTNSTIWIAIRYYTPPTRAKAGERSAAVVVKSWVTEGWYQMLPNEKIQVLSIIYKGNYFYYAVNAEGAYWGGNSDVTLWIKDNKFNYGDYNYTSEGPYNAVENGYYSVPANMIVSSGSKAWTETLGN